MKQTPKLAPTSKDSRIIRFLCCYMSHACFCTLNIIDPWRGSPAPAEHTASRARR